MSRAVLGGQVEGRRAVRELLVARRRRVQTVWLAAPGDAAPMREIVELAARAGTAVHRVTADELASRARTDSPQGVVAVADSIEPDHLDDLLTAPDAFLVALDSVTDPRNLGAVLRSAEGAGATGIVLPRRRASAISPVAAKTAAGSIEHLRFALVGGIPASLDRARRRQVWTVGLDADGDTDLFDLALTDQPLVIVLGAEGEGLGRLTRERCDVIARIPMRGRIRSLNVASAATLACYEVARGRRR